MYDVDIHVFLYVFCLLCFVFLWIVNVGALKIPDGRSSCVTNTNKQTITRPHSGSDVIISRCEGASEKTRKTFPRRRWQLLRREPTLISPHHIWGVRFPSLAPDRDDLVNCRITLSRFPAPLTKSVQIFAAEAEREKFVLRIYAVKMNGNFVVPENVPIWANQQQIFHLPLRPISTLLNASQQRRDASLVQVLSKESSVASEGFRCVWRVNELTDVAHTLRVHLSVFLCLI